eukprot:10810416-Lingulodinium_polyedra.AAC.1
MSCREHCSTQYKRSLHKHRNVAACCRVAYVVPRNADKYEHCIQAFSAQASDKYEHCVHTAQAFSAQASHRVSTPVSTCNHRVRA